jgi:CHAT domain-containing protein
LFCIFNFHNLYDHLNQIKMKINAITFNGTERSDIDKNQYSDDNFELINYYQIETISRGDANRKELHFKENQVVEFEFEDGTNWISTPDTLDDIFPEILTLKNRGAGDIFELPAEISSSGADRSIVGKVMMKVVKIFTKKGVDLGVKKLAENLEDKQLDGKIGLYRLNSGFQLSGFTPDNSAKPWLLLIHGTASSINGSFGGAEGTDFMSYVRDTYNGRILAFQHRTLTENPLQNVKDLVTALPGNCVLHLITTSRGGLVGEVLSRFCNSQGAKGGFNATEISILKKGYPGKYFDEIQKLINDINKILENKRIVIEKFIRIACPAGGTTLASKRLDYFMNITLNLIGIGTGIAANPLYMSFRNLIAALIDSKNKTDVLPGLEVQNPRSPFIKAINCAVDLENPDGRMVINNSLAVIAGNSKPAVKISALWIIASKIFFFGKNDLVVDTDTMILGTRRAGKVLQYFYEDSQINHFKYFENNATNQAILLALKSDLNEKLPGFTEEPLSVSVASDRNINVRPDGGEVFRDEVTGTKPIVLLLPGIMGSNLQNEDKLLWIKYSRIITGGLAGLKISKKLKPASLVSTSYKKIVQELADSYDVVTFPFDWRLPLEDSAAILNRKVNELMKYGQPLKIIGHSMGGVLVRDFMVYHYDTWKNLNNSPGFQLIFLGAPLGGSFRIPAVLFGMDRLIDKLSLIDVVHSKEELIQIFSKFKGLLGLLPLDGEHDFSDATTWRKMMGGTEYKSWPIPTKEDLDWFNNYRNKITAYNWGEEDIKNTVYIAGRDRATPCNFILDEKSSGSELVFLSTAEGDASVTWDSGIPKIITDKKRVYYVNVSHGELACNTGMFKGVKEILSSGSTNLFSTLRPSVRGDEVLFKSPVFRDFDLSEAGIDLSVLGVGGLQEPQMVQVPINVSISNGDLFYAKYPLLAGHFEDDGILFAESEINKNLGEALSYRHRLGIYPGKIGTNELFLSEQSGFKGAIIVGLGKPENLTGPELTKTVEQGVAKYILHVADEKRRLKLLSEKDKTIGISSLIIGSGYGGLAVENSVKAIIQGVHNANVKVKGLNLGNTPLISHIEFVELFEDNAVGALYSLSRLEIQETRSFQIILEEKKLHTLLGLRKRIPNEISSGWWNRITVKKVQFSETDKRVKCITFNASTSRAHEKEKELPTTPALMEGTINEMSTSNRWTPHSAKAIFELLIPNDFKEQLKRHGNINWILDYYTAEFPWELLQDEVADSRPLCVVSGMIRQLSTQNYRQVIKSAPKNNALIIADPDLKGFASQLPGALTEGQKVAEMLSSRGMNITTSFKGNSGEIIEKMFSNDYRIIHLSGHGVFNQDETKGSGMVIGKDVYLSTREINQMSIVPELVFVNCCHIGKISGIAEELYQQRYKLAANIGTQLIENGVRCVIAAGWAVDDNAALEFAQVFYNRIFTGYTFGDSVKDARKVVFEKFGNTNTWGAYQCYGDPFFRFEHLHREIKKKKVEYLISQEAEVDLENLQNELQIGKKTTDEYLNDLEVIIAAVEKAKVRTNTITEKEAMIYFELKVYDKACEKLGSLLNKDEASFSFAVAEKYYNALAKKITGDFKILFDNKNVELKALEKEYKLKAKDETKTDELKNIETQKQECIDLILNERAACLKKLENVISDLEALVQLLPSAERYNILGSTHKRHAFILDNNKQGSYKMAAFSYQKAYSFFNNWYSLTNWLALESVLVINGLHAWGSKTDKNKAELGYQLPSTAEALRLLEVSKASLCFTGERMSYWDMIAGINIGLCKYLLQFSDKSEKIELDNIFNEISELWKKAGSKGKRFAEIEHIEFLTDALSGAKNKNATDLKSKLEQLLNDLAKQI